MFKKETILYPSIRCSSQVGHLSGGQTVSLDDGCVYTDIVQHELMHAAGFWHEQNRYDRDDYVIINWGNIQLGNLNNLIEASSQLLDLNK